MGRSDTKEHFCIQKTFLLRKAHLFVPSYYFFPRNQKFPGIHEMKDCSCAPLFSLLPFLNSPVFQREKKKVPRLRNELLRQGGPGAKSMPRTAVTEKKMHP